MLFPWSREAHRRTLLSTPFPTQWRQSLTQNVAAYKHLTAGEQQTLEDRLRVFDAEKHWEGLGGLTITEEIRVTIAAQACRLTLAREPWDFARVESVLVYPSAFVASRRSAKIGRVVVEERQPESGEAASWGAVALSWADALAGGRRDSDGHNVVLHEFAHQLDIDNGGVADGVPQLDTNAQAEEWSAVMTSEYQALTSAVAEGHSTLMDPYGATNAAEFFAVATEVFFERGAAMQASHPHLYSALRGFYHQDPALLPHH